MRALTSPHVPDTWDWPNTWATQTPGRPLIRHHTQTDAEVAQALAPTGTLLYRWVGDTWRPVEPQQAPELRPHPFTGLTTLCETCGRVRAHRIAHPGGAG